VLCCSQRVMPDSEPCWSLLLHPNSLTLFSRVAGRHCLTSLASSHTPPKRLAKLCRARILVVCPCCLTTEATQSFQSHFGFEGSRIVLLASHTQQNRKSLTYPLVRILGSISAEGCKHGLRCFSAKSSVFFEPPVRATLSLKITVPSESRTGILRNSELLRKQATGNHGT
jgi:hypothetical protein